VTVAGANEAFVSAMNSGFWLSTAVLLGGVAVAAWLLPSVARQEQVEREETPRPDGHVPVDVPSDVLAR